MNDFDKKAAEWDTNPVHWDRSAAIVDEIRRRIRITRGMTAMEYGAGTGIAQFSSERSSQGDHHDRQLVGNGEDGKGEN